MNVMALDRKTLMWRDLRASSFIYLAKRYLCGVACCSRVTYLANSITISRCRLL